MSDVLVQAGKLALFAKKKFEEKLQHQQRDWVDQCLIEMGQVAQVVVVAWLSAVLGKPPRDEEVQDVLARLVDDPSFAARFHLLFSEALRSPSSARRKRLAGVLVAGSKITKSEHQRDRLDRMVAQLGEDDIDTLQRIVEFRNTHPYGLKMNNVPYNMCEYRQGDKTYLSSGRSTQGNFAKTEFTIDPISIDNLVGVGCLARYANPPVDDGVSPLVLTGLGEFLIESLEQELIQTAMRPR